MWAAEAETIPLHTAQLASQYFALLGSCTFPKSCEPGTRVPSTGALQQGDQELPSPALQGKPLPSRGTRISFQFFLSFLHGSRHSAAPHPQSSPCLGPLLLCRVCCSVCMTHLLFCLKLPTSFIIDSSLSFQVSPLHGPTNCPLRWPLCAAIWAPGQCPSLMSTYFES